MYRALIVDADSAHADKLATLLQLHKLLVVRAATQEQAQRSLQHAANGYVLVIVTISDNWSPWPRTIEKLQNACRSLNEGSTPLFLCIATAELRPDVILRIERTGARYVRER